MESAKGEVRRSVLAVPSVPVDQKPGYPQRAYKNADHQAPPRPTDSEPAF